MNYPTAITTSQRLVGKLWRDRSLKGKIFVVICVTTIIGGILSPFSNADEAEVAVATSQTTVTASTAQNRPAEEIEPVLLCQSKSGTQRINGESLDGREWTWADLKSVNLSLDDNLVTVTWETSGAIPISIFSPGGLDKSILYAVWFYSGGKVAATLNAHLIGADWFVNTKLYEGGARTSNLATQPAVEGATLTVAFPRSAIPAEADSWFAIVEGDADLDQDFDFEVFDTVQDNCPATNTVINPSELRLPF